METKEIKKLIADLMEMMQESKLSEVEVEVEGTRVRLRREDSEPKQAMVTMSAPTMTIPTLSATPAGAGETGGIPGADDSGKPNILAPMVGTFYQASSPEADPYVEVGDVVEEDTVVCIIEAMKVMNEIKAEMTGKVVEVLVNNGEAVEYGQPLFVIDTNGQG